MFPPDKMIPAVGLLVLVIMLVLMCREEKRR